MTVITLQDLAVDLRHARTGQRFASLHRFVNGEFELREHHLSIESAAHLLKGIAEVIKALIFGASARQHVLLQEQLVSDRGYFCREDREVGQFIGLILVGENLVHRMTPLMRVSRSAVVIVLMIKQHQRMDVVGGARHVCTRALTGLRIHVHPAFLGSGCECAAIIRTEHLNRRH